jgi:hypothetical protein
VRSPRHQPAIGKIAEQLRGIARTTIDCVSAYDPLAETMLAPSKSP